MTPAFRRGFTVWLTGLPCSGKTTLAKLLCQKLEALGQAPEMLDGDDLRQSLSPDLGFTRKDREEHCRRVMGAVSSLTDEGRPVVTALVSPYRSIREEARRRLSPFVEVYLDCPLNICESRDVKGMYRLARNGQIRRFTGISDDYEPPQAAEVVLQTGRDRADDCVQKILAYLERSRAVRSKFAVSRPVSL